MGLIKSTATIILVLSLFYEGSWAQTNSTGETNATTVGNVTISTSTTTAASTTTDGSTTTAASTTAGSTTTAASTTAGSTTTAASTTAGNTTTAASTTAGNTTTAASTTAGNTTTTTAASTTAGSTTAGNTTANTTTAAITTTAKTMLNTTTAATLDPSLPTPSPTTSTSTTTPTAGTRPPRPTTLPTTTITTTAFTLPEVVNACDGNKGVANKSFSAGESGKLVGISGCPMSGAVSYNPTDAKSAGGGFAMVGAAAQPGSSLGISLPPIAPATNNTNSSNTTSSGLMLVIADCSFSNGFSLVIAGPLPTGSAVIVQNNTQAITMNETSTTLFNMSSLEVGKDSVVGVNGNTLSVSLGDGTEEEEVPANHAFAGAAVATGRRLVFVEFGSDTVLAAGSVVAFSGNTLDVKGARKADTVVPFLMSGATCSGCTVNVEGNTVSSRYLASLANVTVTALDTVTAAVNVRNNIAKGIFQSDSVLVSVNGGRVHAFSVTGNTLNSTGLTSAATVALELLRPKGDSTVLISDNILLSNAGAALRLVLNGVSASSRILAEWNTLRSSAATAATATAGGMVVIKSDGVTPVKVRNNDFTVADSALAATKVFAFDVPAGTANIGLCFNNLNTKIIDDNSLALHSRDLPVSLAAQMVACDGEFTTTASATAPPLTFVPTTTYRIRVSGVGGRLTGVFASVCSVLVVAVSMLVLVL